ncbi:N-acetylmuramoyl-L-alanine amidase [Paenibacillus radicibacter]|uniref:N-acetylmuramoyl-L-alanine amidase n=1 Tax=Paenibacillus radicibacter TaxID=2972488 RepID=UPI002158B3FF|nr:N-acetylmuramoyl-L-alanine amidase [Paenibacillus radicibacter]
MHSWIKKIHWVRVAVLCLLLTHLCIPIRPALAVPLATDTDVIIDVGHGGIDGGTTFGTLYEKDINLIIANKLYKELTRQGLAVIVDRTGDHALSDHNQWLKNPSRHRRDLAQRKQLANELHPKLMVSLHVNWSKRPIHRGPLVMHQNTELSVFLAEMIQNSMNRLFNTRKLAIHGKPFYLLNHTTCPTVIVEMGYISNIEDRNRLTTTKGQDAITKSISEGIMEFLAMLETYQKADEAN